MKMQSVKLVFFSPTGTTKAVVQGIARGINPGTVEELDITRPDARKQPLQTSEQELLIVGVPVYMGRVPALAGEWLHADYRRIIRPLSALSCMAIVRMTMPCSS